MKIRRGTACGIRLLALALVCSTTASTAGDSVYDALVSMPTVFSPFAGFVDGLNTISGAPLAEAGKLGNHPAQVTHSGIESAYATALRLLILLKGEARVCYALNQVLLGVAKWACDGSAESQNYVQLVGTVWLNTRERDNRRAPQQGVAEDIAMARDDLNKQKWLISVPNAIQHDAAEDIRRYHVGLKLEFLDELVSEYAEVTLNDSKPHKRCKERRTVAILGAKTSPQQVVGLMAVISDPTIQRTVQLVRNLTTNKNAKTIANAIDAVGIQAGRWRRCTAENLPEWHLTIPAAAMLVALNKADRESGRGRGLPVQDSPVEIYLKAREVLRGGLESAAHPVGGDDSLSREVGQMDNRCNSFIRISWPDMYDTQSVVRREKLDNPLAHPGYNIASALNEQITNSGPYVRGYTKLPVNPAIKIDWQSTDERADGAAWIPTVIGQSAEDGRYHNEHMDGDTQLMRLYAAISGSPDGQQHTYTLWSECHGWREYGISCSRSQDGTGGTMKVLVQGKDIPQGQVSNYLSGIGNGYHSQLLMYENVSQVDRSSDSAALK
jgi:hypothetical protein